MNELYTLILINKKIALKLLLATLAIGFSELTLVYIYSDIFIKLFSTKIELANSSANPYTLNTIAIALLFNLAINIVVNNKLTKYSYDIIKNLTSDFMTLMSLQKIEREKKLSDDNAISLLLNECTRTAHAVLVPIFNVLTKIIIAAIITFAIINKTGNGIAYMYCYLTIVMLLYKFITSEWLNKLGSEITILNTNRVSGINNYITKLKEIKIFEKCKDCIKLIEINDNLISKSQAKINQITQSSKNVIELSIIIIILYFSVDSSEKINGLAIVGFLKTAPLLYQAFAFYLTYNSNKHSLKKLLVSRKILHENAAENYQIDSDIDGIIQIKNRYGVTDVFKTDKLLITGKSGSGKSIFCDSVTGSYINNKNRISWSKKLKFSIATQSPAFINNSVEENLKFFCEEYNEIKANKLISALFEDTTIIRKNINLLSGGELQRISAIRALLRDSDVYIFDEINSGLDLDSSNKIIELISSELQNKCSIFILHNNIPGDFSKHIVIENGYSREI